MSEVTIYDVDGIPYKAILINNIPEIYSNMAVLPFFPFQIRIRDNIDNICWVLKGQYHRLDGPAIEYFMGLQRWFVRGQEFNSLKNIQMHK